MVESRVDDEATIPSMGAEEKQQQQQLPPQQRKKAWRGTRRQQRYRAKQKLLALCDLASGQAAAAAQSLTTVTVVNDGDSDTMKAIEKNENRAEPSVIDDASTNRRALKRKEELVNTPSSAMATILMQDHIVPSFSQLSISVASVSPCDEPCAKELRTAKSRREKQKQHKQKKQNQKFSSSSSVPGYLNVPNRTFKSMFLSASKTLVTNDDQLKIIRIWLDHHANMQYIRMQARLLDRLLFLQLQQLLWTEYFNVGTNAAAGEDSDSMNGVWASEVHDKIRGQSSNNSIVIDPLSFIIDYRKHIDEQLQKAENELNQHANSVEHLLRSKCSLIRTIDLSAILKALVRQGQHKLKAEFQCKKRMLDFDYQNHSLTKAFFDLKPTKQQIQSARKIWSATSKQQEAEERAMTLKNRLFCKKLPRTFDTFERSLEDFDQNRRRQQVIDNDTRAMIGSRRNKVSSQFKLDMMAISISTAEATARAHAKRAQQEKDKMIAAAAAPINNLISAVQARQDIIIKRAQYLAACKMSFFDETPALIN